MPSPKDLSVFANLPDITEELKAPDRRRTAPLLEELAELTDCMKRDSERIEQLKGLLESIQTKYGLSGLRFGNLAFRTLEVAGRRTLDKTLLVQNGVDPETIEASMKESAPSVRREFRRIEEQ